MAKKKELIQSPKGMYDVLPEEYEIWKWVYDKAEAVASFYGFFPVRTPHLEKLEVFERTVGQATDIVEKQMYVLRPKGGEKLALRPEETAPLVRLYFEHGLYSRPQPVMLYTFGSFFRHEKPQRGRFREFQQFDIEILGEEEPIGDATVIKTSVIILKELGLDSLVVHINSIGDPECRALYRKELTSYFRKRASVLCQDCGRRLKTNPLRILDCQDPQCVELKSFAPQMINFLCSACKNHFREVLEFLEANEIPYLIDHYLVRGLDYYSRTVFEIFLSEDAGEDLSFSLLGGGRYDFLGDELLDRHLPAVGAALGMERVISLLKEKKLVPKKEKKPKVFLIQIGSAAKFKSLSLLEEFRRARIPAVQAMGKDNLRAQLKLADDASASHALILGQKEALDSTIIVRDMESGVQETVPLEKIIDFLKKRLK